MVNTSSISLISLYNFLILPENSKFLNFLHSNWQKATSSHHLTQDVGLGVRVLLVSLSSWV